MTERPILFNGDMVRALLNGSKTQTRRLYKVRKHPDAMCEMGASELAREEQHVIDRACPYGQPGDRLWVRETWSIDMLGAYGTDKGYDSTYALRYRADGAEREIHVAPGEPDPYITLYDSQRGDWRPSIHMPRWSSRILLEITNVRVERLQDLSEVDALAEGISTVRTKEWDIEHFPGWRREFDAACARGEKPPIGPLPTESYRMLWESINGTGSWDANPWVWVIQFGRVKP